MMEIRALRPLPSLKTAATLIAEGLAVVPF